MDDSVAYQVVTRFYKEVFTRPVIDFEYGTTALNKAVVETTGEDSLEKRVVFARVEI